MLVVAAVTTGLLLLLLVGWVAPRAKASLDAATYFVPSELDVVRLFPEVQLRDARFEGLWGERDRGTWIFR